MRAVLLVASLVVPTLARAESWEAGTSWGNDLFTELDPPIDDTGFTNDLRVRISRTRGAATLGLALGHRMLTERGGDRRWDQLDVLASAARTLSPAPGIVFRGMVRVGPGLGGDLGGRWLQNGWHGLTGTGPTLAQGLQSDYAGGHRAALVSGIRMRSTLGSPSGQLHATADGQVALGTTGVSSLELAAGADTSHRTKRMTLGAGAELAVTRYASADANMTIPGGHRTGEWHIEWRVSTTVAWSAYRLTYQYRAEEGGSGEPVGVIDFAVSW